ncbi:MAG: helix-turn-helix domain-containing protein [Planctomycetia bacterium]|nr:helix-turn-helix domain-containing protein [Planctomycetia bacterium]
MEYHPAMAGKLPISETLRRAILSADKTRYQIWKETGVAQSTLSKFVNGHEALSLAAIDKVAECLGLELVESAGKGKSKKRSK